jgi:hypothetical protein
MSIGGGDIGDDVVVSRSSSRHRIWIVGGVLQHNGVLECWVVALDESSDCPKRLPQMRMVVPEDFLVKRHTGKQWEGSSRETAPCAPRH